jgi:WD40 repeat protein
LDLWRQLARLGTRGRLQGVWLQCTLAGHTEDVLSVAVSADGRIALFCRDEVEVWDLASGECLQTLKDSEGVEWMVASADCRVAVSVSGDHYAETLRVWDLGSGACVRTLTGHTREVKSVALSADGRIALSESYDGSVRVWDLASGACLRILTRDADGVRPEAISGDARIAVSTSIDEMVRVWDLASGACLHTLTGHTANVWSVAVSADAHVVVSGSADKTVRVWVLDWEYEFGAEDPPGAAATTRLNREV